VVSTTGPMSMVTISAVPNHNLAVDDGGSSLLRSAEENLPPRGHARHRITDGMEIEGEKVGAFTGFERTNIERPRTRAPTRVASSSTSRAVIHSSARTGCDSDRKHIFARPFRGSNPSRSRANSMA